MPQPPLDLQKYLSSRLPGVKDSFPVGGGATGIRQEWKGDLEGISVINAWEEKVTKYIQSTLPASTPLPSHPLHPYPHFLTVSKDLGHTIKSSQDLQRYLVSLPLAAIAASLTALKAYETGEDLSRVTIPGGGDDGDGKGKKGEKKKLDRAGYESDGGEEVAEDSPKKQVPRATNGSGNPAPTSTSGAPTYGWRFSKSPMGSGEFLLVDETSSSSSTSSSPSSPSPTPASGSANDVKLVVRTINSSAFSPSDWEDLVSEGLYQYNTKSKASWYWSRKYGATKRLGCQFFVLTDYQRWCFGAFTEDHRHANISPIMSFDSSSPTVLEALLYWTRSALGEKNGFAPTAKDVSSNGKLFADSGLARRASQSAGNDKVGSKGKETAGGGKGRGDGSRPGVQAGNESDIDEDDAA